MNRKLRGKSQSNERQYDAVMGVIITPHLWKRERYFKTNFKPPIVLNSVWNIDSYDWIYSMTYNLIFKHWWQETQQMCIIMSQWRNKIPHAKLSTGNFNNALCVLSASCEYSWITLMEPYSQDDFKSCLTKHNYNGS